MQGMAWKHSISMNQYRPPSSEETQNCSQSTKPTTIARPLCPNTIAHFHWTFRSIVKFLHHFLPQLPSYKGHHGCCCIEMLKYWWKSQNLDSSVPCTSHIGKVDDGWCIYIGSCKAKSFKTCPCPFKKPAICDVLYLVFYDLYRRAHEDAMWCQALLQCKHVKTVVHPWTSNHETKIRGIIAKVWISPFQGQSLDSLMIIVWFLWGSTSGESSRCLNILHGHTPLALRWHPSWAPWSCWTCHVYWSHRLYCYHMLSIFICMTCTLAYVSVPKSNLCIQMLVSIRIGDAPEVLLMEMSLNQKQWGTQ